MPAFSHILHPTDFSEVSRAACEKAVELSRLCGAKLSVIHAYADPTLVEGGAVLPDPVPEVRKALDELPINDPSLHVDKEFFVGVPGEIIVHFAKQRQCDLIVMGTHGRGVISRVLLGSVAETVVRGAPCSVLVVRPQA